MRLPKRLCVTHLALIEAAGRIIIAEGLEEFG